MESVGAILKKEEVNVNNYETFNEARLSIFEFIESHYNNESNIKFFNFSTNRYVLAIKNR